MGLTDTLKEYVRQLCEHPDTWIDFPLEEHLLKQKREREEKEKGPRGRPISPGVPRKAATEAESTQGTEKKLSFVSPEDAAVAAVAAAVSHSPTENISGKDSESESGESPLNESGDVTQSDNGRDTSGIDETEREESGKEGEDRLSEKELEDMLELSPKEQRHAMAMLEEVEDLSLLRYDLCPRDLSEERFWRIYFLLVSNKLSSQFLKASDEHFLLSLTAPGDTSGLENAFYVMMSKHLPTNDGKGNVVMFSKEGTGALETSLDCSHAADEVLAWWHAHVQGFSVKESYAATFLHESHGKQGEASKWENLQLKSLKEERSRVFKLLLRCGVPDAYRREVWGLAPSRRQVTEDEEEEEEERPLKGDRSRGHRHRSRSALASSPSSRLSSSATRDKRPEDSFWSVSPCQLYQERLQAVFGEEAPLYCNPIPTFGGNVAFHQFHCISPGGVLAAKRILVVLALSFPQLSFAPALPDLVAMLLLFMPEDEAYRVVETLVCESLERCHYLALGNRALVLFQLTFKYFLHRALPDLSVKLAELALDVSLIFRDWLSRIFVGTLPFQVVLRILDCLLNEGSTVLFRVGLSILSIGERELLTCGSPESARETLARQCREFLDADLLLNQAWSFKGVTHRNLVRKYRSIIESGQMDAVPHGSMAIFTSPTVRTPSAILSSDQFESLWSWVPARHQMQELERLFTTENDGFNLSLLVNSSRGLKPTLLLMETIDGQSFGAFIANEWKLLRSEKEFYGSGENFLFSMTPKEEKFPWRSGQPEQHMILTESALLLGGAGGGDGFGLRLDSELWHGTSQKCDTYANAPLHKGSPEFECRTVELYAIVN